jgi:hypothetical protein
MADSVRLGDQEISVGTNLRVVLTAVLVFHEHAWIMPREVLQGTFTRVEARPGLPDWIVLERGGGEAAFSADDVEVFHVG